MRLVVTVAGPWAKTPEDLARVPAYADLVELRLDLLPIGSEGDVASWVAASPRPVLATVRSVGEGGVFAGTPEEAARLLVAAADAGAAWLDAEANVVSLLPWDLPRREVQVVASLHGSAGSRPSSELPSDDSERAEAWKVARPCHTPEEVRAALAEARILAATPGSGLAQTASVVPYGPLGAAFRVVTAAIAEGAGADPFVFGSPDDSADGTAHVGHQPPLAHLLDEIRLGEISGRARLYGLVGRPPSRSPSPRIHNSAFRALGIDAVYLPAIDLPPVEAFRLPFDGFSVTTPWKEDAVRLCDRLEPLAERIGAVNTVVRGPDGSLVGSNTDAEALRDALSAVGTRRGDAVVIGNGGFAKAASIVLADAGFAVRHSGREAAVRATDAVVVNATPAGNDGVLDAAFQRAAQAIGSHALVVDAPYAAGGRPGTFALACRARGVRVFDGLSLLVAQAAGQVRRFTGADAPPDVLRLALRLETNLVLVGGRGAGKTTIGRAVAERLGRPFVDTDDQISRRAGRPVGRLLAEHGEAALRAFEGPEVVRAAARRGAVIAVGGGALGADGNARALRDHGFVVHLTASPTTAAKRIASDRTERPRLTDAPDLVAECARLAEARAPAYASIARATVATDGRSVDAIASDVARAWVESVCGPREPDFRA